MAIFEKERERPASGPGTVVGTNVRLTGILKDTSDITVHGAVEGEVISERNVTVTESAEIKGPITAQNLIVAGRVTGAITAAQKLEITTTGKVYGSISMKNLIIHSGATFIGKSAMPDQKQPAIPPSQRGQDTKNEESVTAGRPAKKLSYEVEE